MNSTIADALETLLSAIPLVVDVPAGPLSYGTDIGCAIDVDPGLAEVSGARVVVESIIRRLDCPRGGLGDDPSYGYDLRGSQHEGMTRDQIRAVEGEVRAEVLDDDRVRSAVVVASTSPDARSLRVRVTGALADASRTPFVLTLALTDAGALLEEMRA